MLTHKPWSTDSLLLLLLRLFVVLGVVGLTAMLGERVLSGVETEARQFWLTTIGGLVVQIAALLLVARFLKENALDWDGAFGLRRAGAVRQVGLGILVAAVVFGAAVLLIVVSQWLLELVQVTPKPQAAIEALRSTTDWRRQAMVGLTTIVFAPLFEEVVFRGILFVALRQAGYPRVAFWGIAILFAVTHANLLVFLPLVFFALVLNVFYDRSGSLVGPVTAHAAFNGANFLWVLLSGPAT
jgi:membrane protease YdiL (CAAX protease family)